MAEVNNRKVNPQITDSVTQANLEVLGEAPSQSMAAVYQVMATAVGTAMQNATSSQGAMQQIGTAVLAATCAKIVSLSTEVPPFPPPTPTPTPTPSPTPTLSPSPTPTPSPTPSLSPTPTPTPSSGGS